LRIGADPICEKPLVLNPWNLDSLAEMEKESYRKVNTILQLRLHPAVRLLKEKFTGKEGNKKKDIVLTYITSRGNWYQYSWKGDREKSGGLSTNIGIHFFDMLIWLFGKVENSVVHISEPRKEAGYLELENANVRWLLSIDGVDLPYTPEPGKKTTYRSITIDEKDMEFSDGFSDLHTLSYKEILAGNGFGIEDARASIEAVHNIRNSKTVSLDERAHPLVRLKFP
jgi:UDP-N-acetyl-2-amino-2-deoxyglucuronate dehydrogenase